MPGSRRVTIAVAAVLLALAGAGWWQFRIRPRATAGPQSDQSARGKGAAPQTSAQSALGLPAPGSAIEFDALLALSRRDLGAFADWLEKHLAALKPEQRTAFLRELMRRWQTEWQAGAPGGIRDVFQKLSAAQPEVAGRLVTLLPALPVRHLMVQDLIAAWGASDPVAAERWIDALKDGNDRSHGLTSLAEARLRKDAAAALQWATERLATTTNPAIVQDFAVGFAAVDPARTAQWATALPEGTLRTQATVTLATAWADQDPPKASQWAVTLPQSAMRDDAVTVIGQVWTGTAPEEAIKWFGTQAFTSEDARFLAFKDFSEALVDADPDAGQRWIETLKEPATADAARAGAASATFDENPELAVLTAMKIQDIVTRATTVDELMKTWRDDDPAAAEKFAAEHLKSAKKKAGP